MKKIFSSIVTTVLCCLYGAVILSQTHESFHLLKYVPPHNWTLTQTGGVKQYMFSDQQKNDYCILTIYGAANSAGNINTDFSEEWKSRVLSIANDVGNLQPQYIYDSLYPNYAIGAKQVALKNGAGDLFVEILVLRMANNQRQSISFAMPTPNSFANYSDAIASFISSIDNTDLTNNNNTTMTQDKINTNPVNQIPGSNNGSFYYGMQAGSGGFEYGNSKRYLYLNPAGSFRYGYSQEGYYNYNTEADRLKTPDFAGKYTKSGSTIILNFYSGRTMQLNASGQDLDASLYRFIKFPQINGKRFEGTYVKADLIRDLWPNGIQPKAMLHSNGRFEDQGLFGFGETVDVSLPYQEWKQRTAELGMWGNGSYTISDNSLLLNYDDGRKKQLLIYIYQEDANKPSPKLIVVGGQSLTLQ